jgi:3-hydroxyacyl-[acyl-carrier-protein] dehydratase
MRYVLVDRITHLDRGRSLAAIKNVTASDDLVTEYAPGLSALPATMVLEAMAQAAGMLVIANGPSCHQPVLAKVQPFTAYALARPGDQILVRADVEELTGEWCRARVTAEVGQSVLAEGTVHLALVALDTSEANRQDEQLRASLAEGFPEWFGVTAPAEGAS